MLKRANDIKAKRDAGNVVFVESQISDINLPDQVAHCVISNCVVNLVPESDKPKVFKEIFRLLKPGGRVAISDILAKTELPEYIKSDIALYVGCIAGASQVSEYDRYLQEAGFKGKDVIGVCRGFASYTDILLDILIVDTKSDLNVYRESGNSNCCGPACGPANNSTSKTNGCGTSKPTQTDGLDFNTVAGMLHLFARRYNC